MTQPYFGIEPILKDEEGRPAFPADLSTIGIVGPASGALASAYPLNTPVHVNSNETNKTQLLGTSGYLRAAVEAINAQLGEFQFAARMVIVRTAEGSDPDPDIRLLQTINNLIGSSVDGTGIHALLKAPSALGFTPRVIVCPGYTGQRANGVGEITKTGDGDDYVPDDVYTLTFSGGGANAVQGTAHAVGQADGTLGPAILDTPGYWYDSAPTVTAEAPGRNVTAAAVAAGGTGYAVGNTINVGNGTVLTVATISGGGGTGPVATVTVSAGGFVRRAADQPANPAAQVSTNAGGTGATFNLTWADLTTVATYTAEISIGANPVCASLPAVLNQLLGHAYVESSGISQEDTDAWRETMNSKRLIPLEGGVRVLDSATANIVIRPRAPFEAGLLVAVDHAKGAPFHSAANRPVQGIIGPLRDTPYALTDGANEAQELLSHGVGVIVRGEMGNDFALASSGFISVAFQNASDDTLWQFYNQTRGRDFIIITALRALRWYLGQYNVEKHTVQAAFNTLGAILRDLKADGHIIGYELNFNPGSNSPEKLRLGHITLRFNAEEPAPVRLITLEHGRYRAALEAFVTELASQLNLQG